MCRVLSQVTYPVCPHLQSFAEVIHNQTLAMGATMIKTKQQIVAFLEFCQSKAIAADPTMGFYNSLSEIISVLKSDTYESDKLVEEFPAFMEKCQQQFKLLQN